MDPQEAEQTLQEMFGPLLGKRNTPTEDAAKTNPSERPNKTGKQNDGGKGRGHNRPPRAPFRGAGRNAQQSQGQSPAVNKEALRLVTRALIHQQEAIDTLRLSTGWIWWLRIPEPSVIPGLIKAGEYWREQVVLKDSKLKDTPLRQAMFWSLLESLGTAIEGMTEAAIKQARESGWMDEQGHWVFQRWNGELRALEMDARRNPITQVELLSTIKEIQKLTHRDTLSRFHILRKLESEMEGQTVRVMMDVAFRCPEATRLYQLLTTLQGNASLQVAGLQFRQATLQRPPVLKQLMETVFG